MAGIRNFLTNRLTWVSVLFVTAYIGVTRFAPINSVAEFARTATTSLAFIALIGYAGEAVKAYKAHRWPNEPLLAALAICLIAAGIASNGVLQILWRLADFQNFLVTNVVASFSVLMVGAGFLILITAPNLVGRGVPGWTRVRLALAWIIAATVVVGVSVLSPDMRPVAEWLRPWLVSMPSKGVPP